MVKNASEVIETIKEAEIRKIATLKNESKEILQEKKDKISDVAAGTHQLINKTLTAKEEAATSLHNFFSDAFTSMRERLDEMRGALSSALGRHNDKFFNVSSTIKERIQMGWEQSALSTEAFLSDMLGKNHSSFGAFFPKNVTWPDLAGFSFDNPIYPLTSTMKNWTDGTLSRKEIWDGIKNLTSLFCTREVCSPSVKIPPSCFGPRVSLTLVPRTCVIDKVNKLITCDPAKLVLVKVPGVCILKGNTPAVFVGHECRVTKSFGFTKTAVVGGQKFAVVIEKDYMNVKSWMPSSLW